MTKALPRSWAMASIGLLADARYGEGFSMKNLTPSGFPVFGANGQVGFFSRYTHEQPEVLVTCRGATCGTINVSLPKSFVTSNSFVVVPRDNDVLDKGFLRFALEAADRMSFITGTAQPQITLANFNPYEIPLPPRKEQRRIVTKLDAVFEQTRAAKARVEALPALFDKLKRSILGAAFRGDLTKGWRAAHPDVEPASELLKRIRIERHLRWEATELTRLKSTGKAPNDDRWKARYEAPMQLDTAGLPDLPVGWCWAVAEDLADVVDPQPSHRTPPESIDGVPYVGMGDVRRDGDLDLSNARKVGAEVLREHRERYRLKDGDFIFGKIGTLGAPCRLPAPFDYALSANVVLVQPRSNAVQAAWLFFFMLSPQVAKILVDQSRATSQSAFGIKKLREMFIPFPPLDEQEEGAKRIEAALTRVAALGDSHATLRVRLASFDMSVLAKAFRGELVPQDPTDEPASVLLDRIRASRAAEPAPPRGGRRSRQVARPTSFVEPRDTAVNEGKGSGMADTDNSLDLVIATFHPGNPRLTSADVIESTGLRAADVDAALELLVDGGQIQIERKGRGMTYVWINR